MDINSEKNCSTKREDADLLEDILKKKGVVLWSTMGRSMRPLLKTNRDIVEISRPDRVYEDGVLKPNDVALYSVPIANMKGQYVLHRVREVRKSHYVICGDNNVRMELVPFSWVIGVMTGLTRRGHDVNLNGFAYRAYVRLWGSRYRRRVILKRVMRPIKRLLRGPYRALRRLFK